MVKSRIHAVVIALTFATASCAASSDFATGIADIIDGDTIRVSGIVVRMFGIDAPELGQACGEVDCGRESRLALRLFADLGGATVTCQLYGHDTYGRRVGTCFGQDSRDLGASMVGAGYAIAYRRYSNRYVVAEERARAMQLGLWRHGPIPSPEQHRMARR